MKICRNKLLIGSSSFAGNRACGAYYIDETMLRSCREALSRINQKDCCANLRFEGIKTAMIHGMAFRGKQFAVLAEKISL